MKVVEEKTYKAYPTYIDAVLNTKSEDITVEVEQGMHPDEVTKDGISYRSKYVARPDGNKELVYIKKTI